MEQKENGSEAKFPTLAIKWDANTQTVGLSFDPKEFKTWEFVLAVVEMGKRKAEEALRLSQMANLRAQVMQSQEAQEVLGKLQLGRG